MLVERVDGGETKHMTAQASQGSETIYVTQEATAQYTCNLSRTVRPCIRMSSCMHMYGSCVFEVFANHHQLYINNSLPNPGLPSNIFM